MPGLDIQPHSRRVSGLVVGALALLGVASFTVGLAHHMAPPGPSPFPPAQGSAASPRALAANAIPEATPAPDMQLASDTPARRHVARPAPVEPPLDAAPAAGADSGAAVDASAIVPDPPALQAPPLSASPLSASPAPPAAPDSAPLPSDPATPPT
jgi:hypothetical protein